MSFDAFMLRAVAHELNERVAECRVEKILQPSKDELTLLLHREGKHIRLQINAGAAAARIGITEVTPENPKVPPNFCMLARKHLTGAKIMEVEQLAFERAIRVSFETYDELGFFTARHLICEIMGRCSNIILCETSEPKTGNDTAPKPTAYRILSLARPVDFTTSAKRQLLPGMLYELPPKQEKADPFTVTESEFLTLMENSEKTAAEAITESFLGFSPLLSREIAFRADNQKNETLAKEFFRGRLGDVPLAFVCNSWLLFPENENILHEKSNIRKFMARFDITERTDVDNYDEMSSVFDMDYTGNLEDYPENSFLQKAYKDYLRQGGMPGRGFGVFFAE